MSLDYLSPIHRAIRQITLHLEPRVARFGVRSGEAHLLSYLGAYGPCPVGELARVFGWKKSTLTGALDRLEGRGILERSLNPDDRRSLLVELSASGRELSRRVHEPVEELERLISRHVDDDDLAGFRKVMAAIDAATAVEVRPGRPSPERKTA